MTDGGNARSRSFLDQHRPTVGEEPGRARRGVRPYLITGGRTVGHDRSIEIESQVVHSGLSLDESASPESRALTQICSKSVSVAEAAALLSLPLGVTRVLVADLVASGVLDHHRGDGAVDDVDVIRRLMARVRAL